MRFISLKSITHYMYNLQQNVETISCYLKVNNIKKKYFLISIEFKIESVYNVINDPGGQK